MTDPIAIARPEMGPPELEAVRAVIDSGWVTQGPKVAEFEHALAGYVGAPAGVAVSSCTAALHLSLLAAGIGRGDEVIVPSMSFVATTNVVVHAQATPVFAEVEADTFNLDIGDVETRITDRSKAIILVHQLGLPASLSAFEQLSRRHNLVLIEDAACAVGSRLNGTPIGGHGNLACFSFHPRKLLTTGDGGMIMPPNEDDAALLRRLRQHGMSVTDMERHSAQRVIREQYLEVGYNYRLTDIQAAIGLAQLDRLDGIISARQERAAWYDACFADRNWIGTPVVPDGVDWNVQTYTVRLLGFEADKRDRVMQKILDEGIATRAGVMTAHREPAFAGFRAELPVSEAASDCSIALPMHSGLTEADVERVATALIRLTTGHVSVN